MKKVFITIAVLLTGLVFSQTKKKDSLLSKNKTSSAKESKGFYKNVDSASASKYKILNSVPKEQNKYKILKKEEKPAYKFIPTPQTRLLSQPEKKENK
ncbi:TPA: hypothetical protein L3261_000241 [Elizabethkingia anophelis]|uniref:hypothetical protein n=1 Tax=Elizabethkingia anophelis TaxID=1117645 RepID=UPI000750B865|nr:hypothetical protein [Elizabethkingia anophelis]AQW92677.1 hypothetical protein BBD28_16815 [Elizabethkingia anophelis]KUY14819.1 hypothetical protein ATB94_07595 [Elizabethkingia anophelis]MCT3726847.1 hypothetical protein [Elizabethkingia anophelis]MCT4237076.1 hypothetical protein [Elizabethkingia anophelis]MCT4319405.1 hypothetical protein [Elizabethkingia anophelis]